MRILERGNACVDRDQANLNSIAIGFQVERRSLPVSVGYGNGGSR